MIGSMDRITTPAPGQDDGHVAGGTGEAARPQEAKSDEAWATGLPRWRPTTADILQVPLRDRTPWRPYPIDRSGAQRAPAVGMRYGAAAPVRPIGTMTPLKARLQALYEGDTDRAHRFRYALLAFDIATIAFVIVTSFLPLSSWIVACDVVLGLGVLADFAGRLAISRAPAREFLRLSTWTDVVAIASFLAPMFVQASASCASCARFASCAPTSCSTGCARTAPSSGATKRPSWPPPT